MVGVLYILDDFSFFRFLTKYRYVFFAGVAQLVEHNLAKVGVAGSNPVSRSIIFRSAGVNRSTKMEALKVYLDEHGLKNTTQRDIIADIFFRTTTHISLDELLKKAKRKTAKIGYATVYRTMKLLTDSGLAVQRQFGDGQTRFENLPAGGHHDHIICVKCSKIAEFRNQEIEDLQMKMAKKLGYKIINHKLELYGYCKGCA